MAESGTNTILAFFVHFQNQKRRHDHGRNEGTQAVKKVQSLQKWGYLLGEQVNHLYDAEIAEKSLDNSHGAIAQPKHDDLTTETDEETTKGHDNHRNT